MERRTFIKRVGLALTASASALGSFGSACAREGRKKLAKVSPGSARVAVATDGRIRRAQGLDAARVGAMLDRALMQAFGSPDSVSGLRSILDEDDIVGIKLNCLAGPPLSPAPELIDALVGILTKAGVSPDNIVLFERSERDIKKGGLEVRRRGDGPRFVGNDSPGAGYEREVAISGRAGSCLSRILTSQITVMFNLGVLKDHNLAGVSAAMKNLFGIIHNPNKYHTNCCDPFVADVTAYPVVQKKLKLNLVDAITAQCHGGPGYLPQFAWQFNGILASTDPVALDTIAWDIIEKQRKSKGLPTLEQDGRPPKWLATAVGHGLGAGDRAKIKVVRGG